MQSKDFTNPAGELVRVNTNGVEHLAFVPSPLPPDIPVSRDLWIKVSDADRALGELAGVGRNVSNLQLLVKPFIHREAVLSSRIEGTVADVSDVYAFEAGQTSGDKSGVDQADVREVLNYVRATEYGLKQIRHRPMTLGLLRELHERLLSGVRGGRERPGQFRDVQNWIARESGEVSSARFVPPPVVQMHDALRNFDQYMMAASAFPPIAQLAILHYQFEAIHPFRDGNGRIGRLLIGLLLVQWGILPSALLYLSAYFEGNRDRYYELLMEVSRRQAWEDWIGFFAIGIAEQAKDALTRAKQLQDLRTRWLDQLARKRVSALTLRLAEMLLVSPFITVAKARTALKVSDNTARSIIAQMTKAGILTQYSAGRYGKRFVAQEILDIAGKPYVDTNGTT